MINIFIPLKDGQSIPEEVLIGLLCQSVPNRIFPITSPKEKQHFPERNKLKNILRALDVNKEDYFILMDSDVVLEDKEILKEMLDDSKNLSRKIICVTSKHEKIANCSYIPHSLMIVFGKENIANLKTTCQKYKGKDCVICQFVNKYSPLVLNLQNDKISEIDRFEL